MRTKTEAKSTTEKRIAPPPTFKLPTQEKRAAFVRKEMRHLGLSIVDLAGASELCWETVARYADLTNYAPTKNPWTDTTRKIFRALGYDLCFTTKNTRGVIEL